MAGVPGHLKGRSFTRIGAWSRDELAAALDLADELKQERTRRKELRLLPGRTIGLIFAIMIRTYAQAEVEEFAEHASIPIINGLTDTSHPLQALADAMTIRERFGRLEGVRVAYLGDGNNVCASLLRVCGRFGVHVVVAPPAGYEPDEATVSASRADAERSGGSIELTGDPREAVRGADVLYTDVWTSMGQEDERER